MEIYKGNIIFTPQPDTVEYHEDSYIIVENGKVMKITETIPEEYKDVTVTDFGNKLILPGFVDLHLHAAQQATRGLGYDEPDLWFDKITTPVEKMYSTDIEHAHALNKKLAYRLWKNGVINSCIYSTENYDATQDLFETMKKSGLSAMVGKMNSDRGWFGSSKESHEVSVQDTYKLIEKYGKETGNVRLILAPEFIPCCSDEIMTLLGELAVKHNLPITSHMAEGPADTGDVEERYGLSYAESYHKFGLLGQQPTIMAHCIFCDDEEIKLIAETGTFIAHCPQAMLDVPSGRLADMRRFLDAGVNVGIGSDIGGGHSLSMTNNIVAVTQLSKRISKNPVTIIEAYYASTKGGGKFFGNTGSFENGYDFDAIVVDDSFLMDGWNYTLKDRLSRFIYCADECEIVKRFCKGKEVLKPEV